MIDFGRILNNIIVLVILGSVFFLVWQSIKKGNGKETLNNIKNLFGKKGKI